VEDQVLSKKLSKVLLLNSLLPLKILFLTVPFLVGLTSVPVLTLLTLSKLLLTLELVLLFYLVLVQLEPLLLTEK